MADDDAPREPLTIDELNETLEKGRVAPLEIEVTASADEGDPNVLSLPPLAPGWEERVEATVKDHAEHLRADPSWRPAVPRLEVPPLGEIDLRRRPRPKIELEGPVPDSPTHPADKPPRPRFKMVTLDRFGRPPPPPRPPTESPKARERRIRAERDARPAPAAPEPSGDAEALLREFVGFVSDLGPHGRKDGELDLQWDASYGEVLALAVDIRWALWGEWDGDGPPDVGDAARRVRPVP